MKTNLTKVVVYLTMLGTLLACTGAARADDPPPPTPTIEDVLNSNTPETQELQEDVTITFQDVIDQQVIAESECVEASFLTNSTEFVVEGDRAFRQDSDSFTIPFRSDDPAEMLSELKLEENCRNIVVTIGLIQAFAESDLTIDGMTLYELNRSWMDPCLALAGSEQRFFEASALGNLVRVEGEGDARTTYVRDEVQDQCSLFLNVLISKAQVVGIVDNLHTVENWHLTVIANQLPRAVRNDNQYTGRFIVLAFGLKGFGCVWTFGFNHGEYDADGTFNPLGDKRFARFQCEDVPELPPTETTPPGETTPPTNTNPPTTPPSSTPGTTNPPVTTTPTVTTVPRTTVPVTTVPRTTVPVTTVPRTTVPVTTNPCDGPNKPSWCLPPEPTMPATTAPPDTPRPTTPPVSTTPQSNTTAPPPITTPATGEETSPGVTVVGP